MRIPMTLLAGWLLACCAPPALAEKTTLATFCGGLSNAYGPYDYRKGKTEFAENLYLVESAHYTEDVAAGIRGSSGTLAGDLDYTLRAFPNHPGALSTISRVALRDKLVTLPQGRRPVECYFDRAQRFAPDDPAVHALYGSYLYSRNKDDDRKKALHLFLTAVSLDPDNPAINYNAGLALFNAGKHKEANSYAQKAYADGFPLPGLKGMLQKANAWDPSAPLPPRPEREKRNALPGTAAAGEPAAESGTAAPEQAGAPAAPAAPATQASPAASQPPVKPR